MRSRLLLLLAGTVLFGIAGGCSGGGGDDDDDDLESEAGVQEVVNAFLPTILRITSAGLAAKGTGGAGANIPPIEFLGWVSGTAQIGGQVAVSAGENENLNLHVGLIAYSDTGGITFQTDNTSDETRLQFDLQVVNQPPDNTMNGTLAGNLTVSGEVEGEGTFDLTLSSDLFDDDANAYLICTHVTGTVSVGTGGDDTLTVDFVLPLGLDSALNAACSLL